MSGQENEDNETTAPPPPEQQAADAAAEGKGLLSEHKGKLAIGVAATLGLMVYYNWRQKNLPKDDPEGYARLKRLKDSIKASEHEQKHAHQGKKHKPPQEES